MRAVIHIRRFSCLVTVVLIAGCTPTMPAPPAPRTATPVSASFGKTWNAVVDQFAEQNIPIKTIDRASGLIVADPQRVSSGSGIADCGSNGMSALDPDEATWNVLVRGDSTSSTVKATVRFVITGLYGVMRECSTTGQWESAFEHRVKDIAEGRPVAAAALESTPACVGDAAERDGDNYHVTVHVPKGDQPCAAVKECKYRDGAVTMSRETAINRCRVEAKREP